MSVQSGHDLLSNNCGDGCLIPLQLQPLQYTATNDAPCQATLSLAEQDGCVTPVHPSVAAESPTHEAPEPLPDAAAFAAFISHGTDNPSDTFVAAIQQQVPCQQQQSDIFTVRQQGHPAQLQLPPLWQPGSSSAGSSSTTSRSHSARPSPKCSSQAWQPERREVGFNVAQSPASRRSLDLPPVPPPVPPPANQQQPHQEQQQQEASAAAPISPESNPISPTKRSLSARRQVAALAAQGKFDPSVWAAAAAEAGAADPEDAVTAGDAAAAEARQGLRQPAEEASQRAKLADSARLRQAELAAAGKYDACIWAAAAAEAAAAEQAAAAAAAAAAKAAAEAAAAEQRQLAAEREQRRLEQVAVALTAARVSAVHEAGRTSMPTSTLGPQQQAAVEAAAVAAQPAGQPQLQPQKQQPDEGQLRLSVSCHRTSSSSSSTEGADGDGDDDEQLSPGDSCLQQAISLVVTSLFEAASRPGSSSCRSGPPSPSGQSNKHITSTSPEDSSLPSAAPLQRGTAGIGNDSTGSSSSSPRSPIPRADPSQAAAVGQQQQQQSHIGHGVCASSSAANTASTIGNSSSTEATSSSSSRLAVSSQAGSQLGLTRPPRLKLPSPLSKQKLQPNGLWTPHKPAESSSSRSPRMASGGGAGAAARSPLSPRSETSSPHSKSDSPRTPSSAGHGHHSSPWSPKQSVFRLEQHPQQLKQQLQQQQRPAWNSSSKASGSRVRGTAAASSHARERSLGAAAGAARHDAGPQTAKPHSSLGSPSSRDHSSLNSPRDYDSSTANAVVKGTVSSSGSSSSRQRQDESTQVASHDLPPFMQQQHAQQQCNQQQQPQGQEAMLPLTVRHNGSKHSSESEPLLPQQEQQPQSTRTSQHAAAAAPADAPLHVDIPRDPVLRDRRSSSGSSVASDALSSSADSMLAAPDIVMDALSPLGPLSGCGVASALFSQRCSQIGALNGNGSTATAAATTASTLAAAAAALFDAADAAAAVSEGSESVPVSSSAHSSNGESALSEEPASSAATVLSEAAQPNGQVAPAAAVQQAGAAAGSGEQPIENRTSLQHALTSTSCQQGPSSSGQASEHATADASIIAAAAAAAAGSTDQLQPEASGLSGPGPLDEEEGLFGLESSLSIEAPGQQAGQSQPEQLPRGPGPDSCQGKQSEQQPEAAASLFLPMSLSDSHGDGDSCASLPSQGSAQGAGQAAAAAAAAPASAEAAAAGRGSNMNSHSAMLLLQQRAAETLQQGHRLLAQLNMQQREGPVGPAAAAGAAACAVRDQSGSLVSGPWQGEASTAAGATGAAAAGLPGHQRLQKLIPQKPPPRQQQLPARILTWAGAAATSPGFSNSSPVSSSLPRDILPRGRSGSGSSMHGSAGSNTTLGDSDGSAPGSAGSTHRGGNQVIAALIAADNSITGSFKSALLESLCNKDDNEQQQQQQQLSEKGARRGTSRSLAAAASQRVAYAFGEGAQQQQQQQQISSVVAFSFPRTSSSPAFGSGARLAPSLSQRPAASKAGRQFAVGPSTEWVAGGRAAAAAASGGQAGSSSGGSSSTAGLSGAVAAVATAGPVLRMVKSSSSLQQLGRYHQSVQLPNGGQGRKVFSLSPIPASPLSTSSFGGSSMSSMAATRSGDLQQQMQRLGSSWGAPFSSSPKLLHSRTWAPHSSSALTAAVGTASLPAAMLLSRSATAAAIGQQPAAATAAASVGASAAAAGATKPQRQQGLLSVQMRRNSVPDVQSTPGTAALTTAAAGPGMAAGAAVQQPTKAAIPAVAAAEGAKGSETRVRGSSIAATALGLSPSSSLLGCSRSLAWQQDSNGGTEQPQQIRKGRVTWEDDLLHAAAAVGASVPNNVLLGAPGGLAGSAASLGGQPLECMPSSSLPGPSSGLAAAVSAPAAGGSAGLAGAVSATATGRPPASPSMRRQKGGLMRASQSCMDFSNLAGAGTGSMTTASTGTSSSDALAASGSSGATVSGIVLPRRASLDAGAAENSTGGAEQQQQRSNILREAFAAKGHLLPVSLQVGAPGVGSYSCNGGVGSSGSSGGSSLGASGSSSSRVLEAAGRAASGAVPVTHEHSSTHQGAHRTACSAPEAPSLLSCSWHEIEPLLDDTSVTATVARRRSSGSRHGRTGLLAAAAGASGASGGLRGGSQGWYMYEHTGDFYGTGRSKCANSQPAPYLRGYGNSNSSSTSSSRNASRPPSVNGQQRQQEQQVLQRLASNSGSRSSSRSSGSSRSSSSVLQAGAASSSAVAAGATADGQQQQIAATPPAAPGPGAVPVSEPTMLGSGGSSSYFFDVSWWQQQQQHGLARGAAAAAAEAAAPVAVPDAFSFFDLDSLMLLGQAAPRETGRLLRRVIDRLDVSQTSMGRV